MGLRRRPAVAERRRRSAPMNKNVIFTVDATAVPPIYNQDDAQRVNGVTVGAPAGSREQLGGPRQLRLSRQRASSRRTRQQRQPA